MAVTTAAPVDESDGPAIDDDRLTMHVRAEFDPDYFGDLPELRQFYEQWGGLGAWERAFAAIRTQLRLLAKLSPARQGAALARAWRTYECAEACAHNEVEGLGAYLDDEGIEDQGEAATLVARINNLNPVVLAMLEAATREHRRNNPDDRGLVRALNTGPPPAGGSRRPWIDIVRDSNRARRGGVDRGHRQRGASTRPPARRSRAGASSRTSSTDPGDDGGDLDPEPAPARTCGCPKAHDISDLRAGAKWLNDACRMAATRARKRADEGLAPDVERNAKYFRDLHPLDVQEAQKRVCRCGAGQIFSDPDDITHETRCLKCGRRINQTGFATPFDGFLAELDVGARLRRAAELRERRHALDMLVAGTAGVRLEENAHGHLGGDGMPAPRNRGVAR